MIVLFVPQIDYIFTSVKSGYSSKFHLKRFKVFPATVDFLVFFRAPLVTVKGAFGFSHEIELFVTLGQERPVRVVGTDGECRS